jgi:hypothetical protein
MLSELTLRPLYLITFAALYDNSASLVARAAKRKSSCDSDACAPHENEKDRRFKTKQTDQSISFFWGIFQAKVDEELPRDGKRIANLLIYQWNPAPHALV